jgi:hypothetical protein
MAAGTYGSISLSGSHSGNVTLEPDPAFDPNGSGKVTFNGISLSGTNITVHNFYSTGGISISGSNDTADHNDVTNSPGGYGISISGSVSAPAQHDVVSWNKAHGMTGTNGVGSAPNCSTYGDDGDVLRLGPFNDATFIGNDLYNNAEAANANSCAGHTDTLQSFLSLDGSVKASGLVLTKNYVHDETNVQGLPFLKDNDIQNVSVTDNLSARISSNGQTNGPGIVENSSVDSSVANPPAYGIIFEKNTYYGIAGYLQAGGSLPNPTATFDHNVAGAFNTQGGAYSTFVHQFNVYQNTQPTEFTYKLDSTTEFVATSLAFKCGSSCGNGTAAGDDYELLSYTYTYTDSNKVSHSVSVTNTDGIGIDWSPASQVYGPTQ